MPRACRREAAAAPWCLAPRRRSRHLPATCVGAQVARLPGGVLPHADVPLLRSAAGLRMGSQGWGIGLQPLAPALGLQPDRYALLVSQPGTFRGGRCFQLALERFLRARIAAAAHGTDRGRGAPDRHARAVPSGGTATASAAASTASAATATATPPPVHTVPLPRACDASAAAVAGGPLSVAPSFPLAIPPALEAAVVALPAFVGEAPPPLQVSAELRTAWAGALTALEAKQQAQQEEQVKQVGLLKAAPGLPLQSGSLVARLPSAAPGLGCSMRSRGVPEALSARKKLERLRLPHPGRRWRA